ncbi:hypothetical protein ACXR2T_06050 [Leucobacter sp. HY1910]
MNTSLRTADPQHNRARAAGLALIIAPVLGLAIKVFAFPGWMLIVFFFALLPLALGYALQCVIAGTGMLRQRGVLGAGTSGAARGRVAAWITSIAFVLSACSLVDGGDGGDYGSVVTFALGMSSTPQGEQLSTVLLFIAATVWLASWVWLVTEWIVALVRRRRASAPATTAPPATSPAS